MLKTNSKKARAYIRIYILVRIDADRAEEIRANFDRCNDYGHGESFGEFLVNYECALSVYYSQQRQDLARLLEETPEEANRYSDDKVNATYCYLMGRGFCEAFGFSIGYRYNKHRKLVETILKA